MGVWVCLNVRVFVLNLPLRHTALSAFLKNLAERIVRSGRFTHPTMAMR